MFALRAGWPRPRPITEVEHSPDVGRDEDHVLRVTGGALTRYGVEVAASTPLVALSPLPAC